MLLQKMSTMLSNICSNRFNCDVTLLVRIQKG